MLHSPKPSYSLRPIETSSFKLRPLTCLYDNNVKGTFVAFTFTCPLGGAINRRGDVGDAFLQHVGQQKDKHTNVAKSAPCDGRRRFLTGDSACFLFLNHPFCGYMDTDVLDAPPASLPNPEEAWP